MAELFDFEKLAREIVAGRLKGAADAPAAAAEIAKKIIVTGVTSTKVGQEPRATVAAVCRGVMSGLLILDTPLAPAAVALLKQLPSAGQDAALASEDLMTWAMEGIAEVATVSGADTVSKIQDEIEAAFQGAGEVFVKLCERARSKA